MTKCQLLFFIIRKIPWAEDHHNVLVG